jgi:mono/diheme cytochrome c family protein
MSSPDSLSPAAPVPMGYSAASSSLGWRAMFKAKWSPALAFGFVAVAVGSLLAFSMALRARNDLNKKEPRIHLIQDMDNMPKVKHQVASPLFADGRAERQPVAGTVGRGRLQLDDHRYRGFSLDAAGKATFYDGFPADLEINEQLLARGQKMYNITCSLCHGKDGFGNGPINIRANKVAGVNGTAWVAPTSLHDDTVKARANGHLYNTVNIGIRNMAGYGTQLSVEDRWAVVAYVRALQLSDATPLESLPENIRRFVEASQSTSPQAQPQPVEPQASN